MLARERRERDRNDAKGWDRPLCARYDSRPEEKAKEPRGRAESERRRRAWDGREESVVEVEFEIDGEE